MAMGNLMLSIVGSGGGGKGCCLQAPTEKKMEKMETMGKGGGGMDDETCGTLP